MTIVYCPGCKRRADELDVRGGSHAHYECPGCGTAFSILRKDGWPP